MIRAGRTHEHWQSLVGLSNGLRALADNLNEAAVDRANFAQALKPFAFLFDTLPPLQQERAWQSLDPAASWGERDRLRAEPIAMINGVTLTFGQLLDAKAMFDLVKNGPVLK